MVTKKQALAALVEALGGEASSKQTVPELLMSVAEAVSGKKTGGAPGAVDDDLDDEVDDEL